MKPMTTLGSVQHLVKFLQNPCSVLIFGRPGSGGTTLLQALYDARLYSQTGQELTSMYFRQSSGREAILPSRKEGVEVHLIDDFEIGTIGFESRSNRLVAFTGRSSIEPAVVGFLTVFQTKPDLILHIEDHDRIVPKKTVEPIQPQ